MEVFVICLSFIVHTCFCGRYDVHVNRLNVRLNVSAISNYTSRDFSTCAYACMSVTDCLTFNYNMTSRWCELINTTAGQQSYDVTKTNGVVMVDITDYRQAVGGLCSDKPCGNQETCIPNIGSHICVPTELLERSSTGKSTLTSPTSTMLLTSSVTISTASESFTPSLDSLSVTTASNYRETMYISSQGYQTMSTDSIPSPTFTMSSGTITSIATESTEAALMTTGTIPISTQTTASLETTNEVTDLSTLSSDSQMGISSLSSTTQNELSLVSASMSLSDTSLMSFVATLSTSTVTTFSQSTMSNEMTSILSNSFSTQITNNSISPPVNERQTLSIITTGTSPSFTSISLTASITLDMRATTESTIGPSASVSSQVVTDSFSGYSLTDSTTTMTSISLSDGSLSDSMKATLSSNVNVIISSTDSSSVMIIGTVSSDDSMKASMSPNENVIISSTERISLMVTNTMPSNALVSESSVPSLIQSSMTGSSPTTLSISSNFTFGLTSSVTDTFLEPTPTMTSTTITGISLSDNFLSDSMEASMSSIENEIISSTDSSSVMFIGTMQSESLMSESIVTSSVQSTMTGSSTETLSVSSDFNFGLSSTATDALLEPTPTLTTSTTITGISLSDNFLHDSMKASMSSNENVIISSTDSTSATVTVTVSSDVSMLESTVQSLVQSSMTGSQFETLSVSSDFTIGLTSSITDTLLEPTPTMKASSSTSDEGMSETFSSATSPQ